MIIKDLLYIVPVEKLVDIMTSDYGDKAEHREQAIIIYSDLIFRLKEKEPVDTGFIALGVDLLDDFGNNDTYVPDVLIMKKEDLLKTNLKDMTLLETMNVEQCENIAVTNVLNLIKLPETYAIEFNPWDEILGIEVNETNVKEYGADNILAYIINELTFFGFEEESKEPEEEKLLEAIQETEKIMKLPKEERDEHFVSLETALEDWGFIDNRTKEEKDAEINNMRRRILKNYISIYKVLKKYKDDSSNMG